MTCQLLVLMPLLAILGICFVWRKKIASKASEKASEKVSGRVPEKAPSVAISDLRLLAAARSWKSSLHPWTERLFWAACLLLAIAVSNPKIAENFSSTIHKLSVPRSGIALYFLLDHSGSMEETITIDGQDEKKIDLAKQAISSFIENRPNDLIGLVSFARTAQVTCPLTLQHQEVMQRLAAIVPVTEDLFNGTAIGYAIFKTVNLIVATKYFAQKQSSEQQKAHMPFIYNITNQAIIIVTDGLQSPHPEDRQHPFRSIAIDEALVYAKENGVRVYYIGVDPIFSHPDFAADVKQLREAIGETGGSFYLATRSVPIEQIFAQIDTLEKSPLPDSQFELPKEKQLSIAHFFVVAALLCIAAAISIETVFVRTCP